MYPAISLFGSHISTYNLMIGLGLIAAILFYEMRSRKTLPVSFADNLLVTVVLSGFVGFVSAMFFNKWYFYKNWHDFWKHILEFTGMTFLGGLVGGVLAFLIAYKFVFKNYQKFIPASDTLIPSLILAHAFGRIGCFLGGCCYGRPCDILSVLYPKDSLAVHQYGNVPVLPMPLFEAAFLFILFFLFAFKIKKNLLGYYLVFYGVFRFINEYFRGDDRGELFSTAFSPSQYICIAAVIIGGVVLFINSNKNKDESPKEEQKG